MTSERAASRWPGGRIATRPLVVPAGHVVERRVQQGNVGAAVADVIGAIGGAHRRRERHGVLGRRAGPRGVRL
ncbi:hypothetical protein [Streptomyces fractus]|uniref:hypothetical protein n=1 Tax=Streptomyces fractus TaxID=641806 RepID=UPI003CEECB85